MTPSAARGKRCCDWGRAMAVDLAREAEIEPEQVERVLSALCRRRLAMELDGSYVVVGAVT
jgi:hypothetical protein